MMPIFIRIVNLNDKINTSESEFKLGNFYKLLRYWFY